jgi:hypothetical protein
VFPKSEKRPFPADFFIKYDTIAEIKSQMALMPGGMVVTLGFLIFYLCRNNAGFFVFAIAYAFRYKHSSKARLLVVVATVPACRHRRCAQALDYFYLGLLHWTRYGRAPSPCFIELVGAYGVAGGRNWGGSVCVEIQGVMELVKGKTFLYRLIDLIQNIL